MEVLAIERVRMINKKGGRWMDLIKIGKYIASKRKSLGMTQKQLAEKLGEYYGAAEPPVRCGESHLSGLTEPPHFVY